MTHSKSKSVSVNFSFIKLIYKVYLTFNFYKLNNPKKFKVTVVLSCVLFLNLIFFRNLDEQFEDETFIMNFNNLINKMLGHL